MCSNHKIYENCFTHIVITLQIPIIYLNSKQYSQYNIRVKAIKKHNTISQSRQAETLEEKKIFVSNVSA